MPTSSEVPDTSKRIGWPRKNISLWFGGLAAVVAISKCAYDMGRDSKDCTPFEVAARKCSEDLAGCRDSLKAVEVKSQTTGEQLDSAKNQLTNCKDKLESSAPHLTFNRIEKVNEFKARLRLLNAGASTAHIRSFGWYLGTESLGSGKAGWNVLLTRLDALSDRTRQVSYLEPGDPLLPGEANALDIWSLQPLTRANGTRESAAEYGVRGSAFLVQMGPVGVLACYCSGREHGPCWTAWNGPEMNRPKVTCE